MGSAVARRRGRPRVEGLTERRQEEILNAASTIFAHRGYRQTDLQDVADALAVGKGTLYRYFPTKQALFLAAVDRGMRLLSERIDAAVEAMPPSLEMIAVAIREYLAFFEAHAEIPELLLQERAEFRSRKKGTYFIHQEAHRGRWERLLTDLISRRVVRDVPVERILGVLADLLYGTLFTNTFAGRRKSLDAQAEDIIDIALHGIQAPRRR